jgi:hypothetical protein
LDYHLSKRYYDRSIETSPKDAYYPNLFGLFSLYVTSSWSTSSNWKVLINIYYQLFHQWMNKDSNSRTLILGDIPMFEVIPYGDTFFHPPSKDTLMHIFQKSIHTIFTICLLGIFIWVRYHLQ